MSLAGKFEASQAQDHVSWITLHPGLHITFIVIEPKSSLTSLLFSIMFPRLPHDCPIPGQRNDAHRNNQQNLLTPQHMMFARLPASNSSLPTNHAPSLWDPPPFPTIQHPPALYELPVQGITSPTDVPPFQNELRETATCYNPLPAMQLLKALDHNSTPRQLSKTQVRPTSGIRLPSAYDVLCGRGVPTNKHREQRASCVFSYCDIAPV